MAKIKCTCSVDLYDWVKEKKLGELIVESDGPYTVKLTTPESSIYYVDVERLKLALENAQRAG